MYGVVEGFIPRRLLRCNSMEDVSGRKPDGVTGGLADVWAGVVGREVLKYSIDVKSHPKVACYVTAISMYAGVLSPNRLNLSNSPKSWYSNRFTSYRGTTTIRSFWCH